MITRSSNEKPEDFLIKYGQAVKDKIDSQRIDNLRREVESLSFKPQVSKMSEKIHKQKMAQHSRSGSQ